MNWVKLDDLIHKLGMNLNEMKYFLVCMLETTKFGFIVMNESRLIIFLDWKL